MGTDRRRLVYAPTAQRDLGSLERRFARQVLEDLPLLATPPWPPGKVKKLHGCPFWELKCGDFRAVFWPRGKEVAVLRIVNRRELDLAIRGLDRRAVERWLQERNER
jgi:mRNA-degrading endonuclease RelE of RelBE toxin-antitoxin system